MLARGVDPSHQGRVVRELFGDGSGRLPQLTREFEWNRRGEFTEFHLGALIEDYVRRFDIPLRSDR